MALIGKGFVGSWGLVAMIGVLAAGCRAEPAILPSPTVAAGAVVATLTPRPALTSTPAATAAATALAPVVVTATPTRDNGGQPTATAEASPTATVEGMIGPDNFPPDVNPLTGEMVGDPALLARRPIAVKISNAPAIVRPQAGLSRADLVFEHYAEGGLTRFTALFYGQDVTLVGSVRSGRLIDLEIPKMYDAAFGFSGAAGLVRLMFRDSPFFERIISPDFGHGGFFRMPDPNKAIEHTMFTNLNNLRAILEERGQNTPPRFGNHVAFRVEPVAEGETAGRLELRYEGANATWVYGGDGRYWRWSDGAPHLDATTGQQLNFKNVVVVEAHHEETDILEDNVGGGHYSIQIQIWGEGPVSIFRDGRRFDGRWRRQEPDHMLTFYDNEGNILPLSPGNTFFQIVPLGFDGLFVSP